MIQLKINYSKAEDVITRLSIAFKNRMGVFADTKELLENNIPLGVSPDLLGCYVLNKFAILYQNLRWFSKNTNFPREGL